MTAAPASVWRCRYTSLDLSLRVVPLPRDWSDKVKTALGHCLDAEPGRKQRQCRVRHAAKLDRVTEEVSLLRDELRLEDARMGRFAPQRRPHYRATERMGILELKAARGWS